jgi:hypothetical protein
MGNTPAAQKTLTSLKLEPQEFDSFKVTCVRTKFSLSKLNSTNHQVSCV